MKEGIITKLIAGQYTIKGDDTIDYQLKPLGVFRHKEISPKVGDRVVFNRDHILQLKPRRNDLVRPPIANVDQAILIHSAAEPAFSFNLLDRFLVLVEAEDITPIIIVSKIDLLPSKELHKLKEKLAYYEDFYQVFYTTVHDQTAIEPIKEVLRDKISVFAGQTGAGKSSLLNALDTTLSLKIGEISKALGRGRHTTRHTELLALYGGLVADTPGFSKLDFQSIELELLQAHYPDFVILSEACRFRGCHHINEPKCAVKEAVDKQQILPSRYDNYVLIYEEIQQQKKRY